VQTEDHRESTLQKSETRLRKVLLEAMMLSCAKDAKQGRQLAVTDILGDFLHADMDQDVHMLLEGKIAELIRAYTENIFGKTKPASQC